MIVLDIETTTNHKEIRLVGVLEGAITTFFTDHDSLLRSLKSKDWDKNLLITWNGAAFDLPKLNEIWGLDLLNEIPALRTKHRDGMLLSQMITPDRHSHSLASYGDEFDFPKGEVDYDFAPIDELAKYLETDLQLTLKAYTSLSGKLMEYVGSVKFKEPLIIEQKVSEMIAYQGTRGIGFDYPVAMRWYHTWQAKLEEFETEAKAWLPRWEIPKSRLDHPPKTQFKKGGELTKYITDYMTRNGVKEWDSGNRTWKHPDGTIHTFPITAPIHTHRQLKLGDTTDLKKWLLTQGWEPSWWNYKDKKMTTPRLTHKDTKEVCPGIAKVSSVDGELISNFLTLNSRVNVLRNLIIASNITSDGLPAVIHHSASTLGTPTARFRHRVVVNIPRVSSAYGAMMRSCFIPVDPGHVQVGWDASSLEATIEAHHVFKYDSSYAKELVSGDIHTRNMEELGLPSRDKAKELKYALTYGAQPPRVSDILGVTLREAQDIFDKFWELNRGLDKLKQALYQEWVHTGKKFIRAIDGRPLFVRYPHAILNTKLQGDGAILMKVAYVIAETTIKGLVPDAYPLIRYHDEEQWECSRENAELVGSLGVKSIERAGKHFDLNVPITGEYKIGENWAECH